MDNTEDKGEVTGFILRAMTNAILGSPEFDGLVVTHLWKDRYLILNWETVSTTSHTPSA